MEGNDLHQVHGEERKKRRRISQKNLHHRKTSARHTIVRKSGKKRKNLQKKRQAKIEFDRAFPLFKSGQQLHYCWEEARLFLRASSHVPYVLSLVVAVWVGRKNIMILSDFNVRHSSSSGDFFPRRFIKLLSRASPPLIRITSHSKTRCTW